MEEIYFVYITTKNRIAAYALSNPMLCGDYIQGYCTTRGGYRTFRAERIFDFFESLEQAENHVKKLRNTVLSDSSFDGWYSSRTNEKRYKRYESPGMLQPLDFSGLMEICFTGFKKADKERLILQAKEAEMIVRQDVTTNLHFLCCGYNAGPAKMEAARKKGTMILREPEFLALIDTGVLPDDYDE